MLWHLSSCHNTSSDPFFKYRSSYPVQGHVLFPLLADGNYLMLAGTMYTHSSGVPRVGQLASRAMGWAPFPGRGRPSDGG